MTNAKLSLHDYLHDDGVGLSYDAPFGTFSRPVPPALAALEAFNEEVAVYLKTLRTERVTLDTGAPSKVEYSQDYLRNCQIAHVQFAIPCNTINELRNLNLWDDLGKLMGHKIAEFLRKEAAVALSGAPPKEEPSR